MTGVSEKAPPSQIDEKAMAWDDVAVEHLDQSAEFPDPDEGKSDEERATLVRSKSCNFGITQLTSSL